MATAIADAVSSARARVSRSSRGWRTAETTSAWISVPTIAMRRNVAAMVQKRLPRKSPLIAAVPSRRGLGESIARPPDRLEIARVRRILLELPAHAADQAVDRSVVDHAIAAPHL